MALEVKIKEEIVKQIRTNMDLRYNFCKCIGITTQSIWYATCNHTDATKTLEAQLFLMRWFKTDNIQTLYEGITNERAYVLKKYYYTELEMVA